MGRPDLDQKKDSHYHFWDMGLNENLKLGKLKAEISWDDGKKLKH